MLDDLLVQVLKTGGSDLHLTLGAPPTIRVRGEMQILEGYPPLTSEQLQTTVAGGDDRAPRRGTFEENLEPDFAYMVPGARRFRVNVFQQRRRSAR